MAKKTKDKVEETPVAAPASADPRQDAWNAFLVKAEAQAVENGTVAVFNAQKVNGEFDKIPATFVG